MTKLSKSADMPFHKRIIISTIILLFGISTCHAGDTLRFTSSRRDIHLRIPDQHLLDPYLIDKGYQYGAEYKPPAGEGIIARLWRRLLKMAAVVFGEVRYLPLAIRIFLLLSILLIVYVIATKTKLHKIFYVRNETTAPDIIEVNPENQDVDFEWAIQTACSQKNYRNAIRLMHLRLLRDLERKEFIRLSKDKTNRDYTHEISTPLVKSSFVALTTLYNQVWYGKLPLTASEYESVATDFNQLTLDLYAKN